MAKAGPSQWLPALTRPQAHASADFQGVGGNQGRGQAVGAAHGDFKILQVWAFGTGQPRVAEPSLMSKRSTANTL